MAAFRGSSTLVKLDELPSELILKILYYLDFKDLVSCSKVNRRLHDLSNHEAYWKYQCEKYWLEKNCHSGNTWKQQFSKWYCEFKNYIDCFTVIKSAWDKVMTFTERYCPKIYESINNGARESDLDEVETALNMKLPSDFRCAYRIHNGQKFSAPGMLGSIQFPNPHYGCVSEHLLDISTALETFQKTQKPFGCLPFTYAVYSKISQCIALTDVHGFEPGTVISLPMDHSCSPEDQDVFISGQSFAEWFTKYANSLENHGCVVMLNQIFRFNHEPSFEETTGYITVKVATQFVPQFSTIEPPCYFHSYRITMTMSEDAPKSEACQLMTRHWIITDENGYEEHVDGPGVVGHFPIIHPGTTFSWVSSTHFPTTYGSMKGHFSMENLATGSTMEVRCPTFHMKCLPYITKADRQAVKAKLLSMKKSQ